MKKILGGLKAILTAEAGGAERFFGTEKKRFPGAFPVNFGHSLRARLTLFRYVCTMFS